MARSRAWQRLTLALAVLLMLTGCSGWGFGGSSDTGQITISLWYWNRSIDPSLFRAFEKQHPNIKINDAKIGGDYASKLRTNFAGKAFVPDVVGLNSDVATYFPAANQFVDLYTLGAKDVQSEYLPWKWNAGVTPDGKMIYQIAYFIPNVTSLVAIAIIFSSIFGNQFGLLNALLQGLGLDRIEWLNTPWGIRIAIAAMVVWRWTGYNAIIYLAGLQAIPGDLYEAAKLDGGSSWNLFKDVTVPLLRPVILFTVITSTIGGLQIFTEPQVLVGNNGGPGNAGMTMVLYLYQQAFVQNQFGYGAAIGWGLFVVIIVFSIVNWRILNRPSDL